MESWKRHNQRRDVHTAALIDHAQALQGIAGPSMAYDYLRQWGVPLPIIKRVLSCPCERRQPGIIGLAPMQRG